MQQAEFDKFADEYLASHAQNLRITGEDPAYFSRYKIEEIRRQWNRRRPAEPAAILDFGSGIGGSLPHLKDAFPGAGLTAFDVSERSLAIAQSRFPGVADFVHGADLGALGVRRFDLVFASCVFHHIDETLHVGLLAQLRGLLRPDGWLVVFEHNPVNPVTRYIVATCPFDENAVLIPAGVLAAREKEAGFGKVETRFTGFFPHALAKLRPLEPLLSAVPLGAQYYTLAHG